MKLPDDKYIGSGGGIIDSSSISIEPLSTTDVGQGAHDDAGGCVAAWRAVTLIKELGLKEIFKVLVGFDKKKKREKRKKKIEKEQKKKETELRVLKEEQLRKDIDLKVREEEQKKKDQKESKKKQKELKIKEEKDQKLKDLEAQKLKEWEEKFDEEQRIKLEEEEVVSDFSNMEVTQQTDYLGPLSPLVEPSYNSKQEMGSFAEVAPQQRSSGGEVLSMRNRMYDAGRMNNLSPIEKQLVGPGLGVGPEVPAFGGNQQLFRVK